MGQNWVGRVGKRTNFFFALGAVYAYMKFAFSIFSHSEGFEYFYRNSSGSIDEWVEFWGHMADRFTGNPAVIGYDLINEPWIGDYISYPDQLLPGRHSFSNRRIILDTIRTYQQIQFNCNINRKHFLTQVLCLVG